jgi:hypothetical protein
MKQNAILELGSLAVMLTGFVLRWLDVDPQAVVLHIGFALLGTTGIFTTFKSVNTRASRTFNLACYSTIIFLVAVHFVFQVRVIPYVVIALVIQYFVNQRKVKATS